MVQNINLKICHLYQTRNLAKKEKIFSESFQDTVTTLKQALSDDTFDTFQIFLEYKKLLSNDEEKVRNII